MIFMSFVLTFFMTVYLRRENARRDASLSAVDVSLANYSDEMRWEDREKGDDAPFFRYTV